MVLNPASLMASWKSSVSSSIRRKDALAILGLVVLLVGLGLLVYGLIPIPQARYTQIADGPVPLTDAAGNFVTSPENYFRDHYTGTGSLDQVDCSPSINGYYCYGFQFIGTVMTFSLAAKEYGAGMMILGVAALLGASKLLPPPPKSKHLRPMKTSASQMASALASPPP
jgi:hypothetical protein